MTLAQIESSILALSQSDIARLTQWFEQVILANNDAIFENRVLSGEFDALAAQAMQDGKSNNVTNL